MTHPPWRQTYLKRHIALPQDHGAWVLLLSPLVVGLFAGSRWTPVTLLVVLASLVAFLIRQPITVAVKAYSGRRSRRDLPASRFWISVYGLGGLLALAGITSQGGGYILLLALPGFPVFVWYLYLVSQRAERRQIGVEVVASGVLALAAPAAMWAGQGYPDPRGWWLWGLIWLQSAASIVYAYQRLAQRQSEAPSGLIARLRFGFRALAYSAFNLIAVIGISVTRIIPPLLALPYALQLAETIYGTIKPAAGQRPSAIGIRQLVVSSLFTLLFVLTWRIDR